MTVERWFDLEVEPLLDPVSRTTFAQSAATPFGLLREPVRWELLYAVQQRDIKGYARMTPVDLRLTYLSLRRNDRSSVVGDLQLGRASEVARDSNAVGFVNDLQWFIDDAHRAWTGVDNRDPKVIYFSDLELRHTNKNLGRDANMDLRAIQIPWIVEAVIAWAKGAARGFRQLNEVQTAWIVADEILRQRGTPIQALGSADIDAIVKEIKSKWKGAKNQKSHIGAISKVIHHARDDSNQEATWCRVPPLFAVNPAKHMTFGPSVSASRNSDEPFRFVPQPIIDWVMDHLELLDRGDTYRTAEARAMIFIHERCGRRTGETLRLEDECLSYDNQGAPFLE